MEQTDALNVTTTETRLIGEMFRRAVIEDGLARARLDGAKSVYLRHKQQIYFLFAAINRERRERDDPPYSNNDEMFAQLFYNHEAVRTEMTKLGWGMGIKTNRALYKNAAHFSRLASIASRRRERLWTLYNMAVKQCFGQETVLLFVGTGKPHIRLKYKAPVVKNAEIATPPARKPRKQSKALAAPRRRSPPSPRP